MNTKTPHPMSEEAARQKVRELKKVCQYEVLRHDINRVCAHPAGCYMPAERGSIYCAGCNTERF